MKMYCAPNSVRIVGKAWEVRTKLKQMCRRDITVSEWLSFLEQQQATKNNRATHCSTQSNILQFTPR